MASAPRSERRHEGRPIGAEAGRPGTSNPESAQVRAQLQLRELILSGELPGGARIAELAIVERLGVSRTPIRAALMRLEQEGLLEALPNGGYAVKTFTERDISESIELRGTSRVCWSGLAAERGAPPVVLGEAPPLPGGDRRVPARAALSEAAFSQYVALNERFHALLREMAGSDVITHQLDRVMSLPFASPSAFVVEQARLPAGTRHAGGRPGPALAGAGGDRAARGCPRRSVSCGSIPALPNATCDRAVRDHLAGARVPGVQLIRRRS
jgi:DNA-binding GntR family transcriptional regulator